MHVKAFSATRANTFQIMPYISLQEYCGVECAFYFSHGHSTGNGSISKCHIIISKSFCKENDCSA